uniref:RNase H type-1 domain-containing protein n=1 Tax=Pelusios castaneus TaxID=367368 RepID=A0A8C8SCZ4_9SAUR
MEYNCLETVDLQHSSRADLRDQPLPNPDFAWYTDGSSMVVNGQCKAGYAVVSLFDTIEAQPLPPGTSAQLAELIALTRALELATDKRVNIFTDSRTPELWQGAPFARRTTLVPEEPTSQHRLNRPPDPVLCGKLILLNCYGPRGIGIYW